MSQILLVIGPEHDGQRMSLHDFANADAAPGYRYELARGVVQVVEVPDLPHGSAVAATARQFWYYDSTHSDVISYMATGSDCKLLLPGMQCERHPDLTIYLTPPPKLKPIWQYWIPDLVIEVVSPGQEKRDYQEKREEYLVADVREYWIMDPAAEKLTVLRRSRDQWHEESFGPDQVQTTSLLSGLEFRFNAVVLAYQWACASAGQ